MNTLNTCMKHSYREQHVENSGLNFIHSRSSFPVPILCDDYTFMEFYPR